MGPELTPTCGTQHCDVFTMAAWSVGLQTAHQVFCPLVFLHNLTLKLYISQPMLAWLWTCPTCTWPPCSSINTTSSLEQWPAGCRYTHPHIFLVKVGLLKLLHVVGGLLRAQINHCKVFPTWSTNRISLCWIWSGHTSS